MCRRAKPANVVRPVSAASFTPAVREAQPVHATHSRRSCKRRAVDGMSVHAAMQTKLDIDTYVQHSRTKRLEILEVGHL